MDRIAILCHIILIAAPCVALSEMDVPSVGSSPYVVAVFSGHTATLRSFANQQGAKSASGVHEYRFNDRVVLLLGKKSDSEICYKTFPASLNIPLRSRPALAEKLHASLLVEIHHDSVQPQIYGRLVRARTGDPLLRYYRGFSLHTFPRWKSIALAKAVESKMIEAKLKWSEYHREDIPGERMKLIPGTKAVYARKRLFVLRTSRIPAVIVECGCIANPEEERILQDGSIIQKMVDAIDSGIREFLNAWGSNRRADLYRKDTAKLVPLELVGQDSGSENMKLREP